MKFKPREKITLSKVSHALFKKLTEEEQIRFVEKKYPYWASHNFHKTDPSWQKGFIRDNEGWGMMNAEMAFSTRHLFQSGQRVRIKPEIIQTDLSPSMDRWLGKVVTISSCAESLDLNSVYFMRDCPRWFWNENQLESVGKVPKKEKSLPSL